MKRFIKFIVSCCVRLTDYICPKSDDLVLFGQRGVGFSDNSRALFEYLNEHSSLKGIWLTTNKKLINNVEFFHPYSLRGLWAAIRARTFIVSHGLADIPYARAFSSRKYHIIVWHGISLKRIGVLDNKLSQKEKRLLLRREYSKYTSFIASSELDAQSIQQCVQLESHKIRITGLPRSDKIFYKARESDLKIPDEIKQKLHSNIILYAPTFRDSGETRFFPFEDLNLGEISRFLNDNDAFLFMRPHPNDTVNINKIKKIVRAYGTRFVLADNINIPDVQDILPFVNVITTDYSSIFIDLLLKDCSCVFIPYDLKEYVAERGLLYDYESITPGPKVFSQSTFLKAIGDSLNNIEFYKQERITVREMFHKYNDASSSQRVLTLIEDVLARKEP